MKRIVLAALLLGVTGGSAGEQQRQEEISDLGLGLISEEFVLTLDECVTQGEKTGNYKSCDLTRFYYAALKKLMKERDINAMSATDRLLIEKRLGILEALQLTGNELEQ